jgi:thioredoxin-like negative regulator of GroEL
MRNAAWTLYLWPGLPALWRDGSWTGLAVAVAWGAVLNLWVVASWVWFEFFADAQLVGGWAALSLFWLVAAIVARRSGSRKIANNSAPAIQDLFQSAMTEYLRGHWYDAEAAVSRLVAKNPKDVEARLLWATLLRRTRRVVEARAQLKQLERLDRAATWREEIAREWQALGEIGMQGVTTPSLAAGAKIPADVAQGPPAAMVSLATLDPAQSRAA